MSSKIEEFSNEISMRFMLTTMYYKNQIQELAELQSQAFKLYSEYKDCQELSKKISLGFSALEEYLQKQGKEYSKLQLEALELFSNVENSKVTNALKKKNEELFSMIKDFIEGAMSPINEFKSRTSNLEFLRIK